MRMKSSIAYDKNGFIKELSLKIYPDDIAVKGPSRCGQLEFMDAVKAELIKDHARFLKEQKTPKNKAQ